MINAIKEMKFSFSLYGLILFFIIMLPNFIWFAYPAPNDVLRNDSQTIFADTIASICQVVMVISLTFIVNIHADKFHFKSKLIICSMLGILIYFSGWILYYMGVTNAFVILVLCIAPCIAFLLFEMDRKNWVASVPTILFMIFHIYYGIKNFII